MLLLCLGAEHGCAAALHTQRALPQRSIPGTPQCFTARISGRQKTCVALACRTFTPCQKNALNSSSEASMVVTEKVRLARHA